MIPQSRESKLENAHARDTLQINCGCLGFSWCLIAACKAITKGALSFLTVFDRSDNGAVKEVIVMEMQEHTPGDSSDAIPPSDKEGWVEVYAPNKNRFPPLMSSITNQWNLHFFCYSRIDAAYARIVHLGQLRTEISRQRKLSSVILKSDCTDAWNIVAGAMHAAKRCILDDAVRSNMNIFSVERLAACLSLSIKFHMSCGLLATPAHVLHAMYVADMRPEHKEMAHELRRFTRKSFNEHEMQNDAINAEIEILTHFELYPIFMQNPLARAEVCMEQLFYLENRGMRAINSIESLTMRSILPFYTRCILFCNDAMLNYNSFLTIYGLENVARGLCVLGVMHVREHEEDNLMSSFFDQREVETAALVARIATSKVGEQTEVRIGGYAVGAATEEAKHVHPEIIAGIKMRIDNLLIQIWSVHDRVLDLD